MSLSYMGSVSAKNIEFLSELTHQNRKHETFCSVSFAPFSEIYFKILKYGGKGTYKCRLHRIKYVNLL